jgi:hypothetical protein
MALSETKSMSSLTTATEPMLEVVGLSVDAFRREGAAATRR